MYQACRQFCREEQGVTTVEYTLMVAMVIVAAIATLGEFGDRLDRIYTQINAEL